MDQTETLPSQKVAWSICGSCVRINIQLLFRDVFPHKTLVAYRLYVASFVLEEGEKYLNLAQNLYVCFHPLPSS